MTIQNTMHGKTVLVTGATSGIGKATAQALASMRAHVIITGRNADKIAATVRDIQQASGHHNVDGLQADFESLVEVRRLADEVTRRYDRLDVLINNAGALFGERGETLDGYERTFAVNHLASFLLTNLLLPLIKHSAPARIVNVSSDGHRMKGMDFADLHGQNKYNGMQAYAQSKLANVLFTYELARQLQGSSVTVNALHPGGVATNFGNGQPGLFSNLLRLALRVGGKTPAQGAQTSIYLASSPEVAHVTGKYFANCRAVQSSTASYDVAAAQQLWQISAKLTGLDSAAAQPALPQEAVTA